MNAFSDDLAPRVVEVAQEDEETYLRDWIAMLRRRWPIIIALTMLSVLLALIYVFTAQAKYTAAVSILIVPRQNNAVSELIPTQIMTNESLVVDNEIELIKSSELLRRVALSSLYTEDKAKNSHSFIALTEQWMRNFIRDWLKIDETQEDLSKGAQQLMADAQKIDALREGLTARRVGRTYVIEVEYTSENRELAAKFANAVAQAYLDDKREVQFADARQTNEWLATRIEEMKQKVVEAEGAVALFKQQNNIVSGSKGLLSDQQLSELNSLLIIAQTETDQARAKVDAIKNLVREKGADAAVEDIVQNPTILALRKQYVDTSQSANAMLEKVGDRHLAYLNIRAELERIRVSLLKELRRMELGAESAYSIALARQTKLESSLQTMTTDHNATGEKEVKLRELERQAEALRDHYKTLLDSYRKSNEQETFSVVRARIIQRADIPLIPSWPKRGRTLVMALVFGVGLGIALAYIRETLDRKAWTQEDLDQVFRGRFLGHIPVLALEGTTLKRGSQRQSHGAAALAETEQTRILRKDVVSPHLSQLTHRSGALTEVLRNILLSFRLAASRRQQKGAQTVSFVSTMPSEGKSTVSLLQALYLAGSGHRTLLIDSDFRSPALTNSLAPISRRGLVDLVTEEQIEPRTILWREESSSLDFLPASGIESEVGAAEMALINDDVTRLVAALRPHYDYIVIDVPPILFLSDARVMADALDHIVFVAEWGKVEKGAIAEAVRNSPELARKIVGAVFNKVDLRRLRRHSGAYGNYGYKGYSYGYGYGREE